MSEHHSPRAGLIAAFFALCIWTGFILVSRYGGKGVLTGWDVTALRFGVGSLIALFFLPRVTLPPYKVILLFSMFGGIGYSVVVLCRLSHGTGRPRSRTAARCAAVFHRRDRLVVAAA